MSRITMSIMLAFLASSAIADHNTVELDKMILSLPEGWEVKISRPDHAESIGSKALFHVQFDNVNIIYQMTEAMYFFSMEDCWDDADEVLGPILDQGRAITFSMEPYNCAVNPLE